MKWLSALGSRLSAIGFRLSALGLLLLPGLANAQQTTRTPAESPRELPRNLQVFLVTLGEGEYYWEKFGHNALWFYDPTRGIDIAYNWGVFDFGDPEFLKRVITADTRYWVEGKSAPLFLDDYQRADRSITIQRLNFTQDQADSAFSYSRWNALDANKYYQYDYFRDNCSTRVRDVIDRALGGALRAATDRRMTDRSYRLESLRLVDDMKIVQFGINTALGEPSDEQLSEWEAMFVPSTVQRSLAAMQLPRGDGTLAPVVLEERVVYESKQHRERDTVPSLTLPYLIVGLLLGAALFFIGRKGETSLGIERVFRTVGTLVAFITGLLGLVVLLGWLITGHVFWFRNENLLLLNPLALFLAALIPISAFRPLLARATAICAVIIAMLAALALVMKGIPVFSQNNLSMILLLLPVHFAIAHAFWRRAQRA